MAAKDHEFAQEFPVAKVDVPSKDQIEEAVALSVNVQDGQQSLGQSSQDPYTHAVSYLEKHHIVEILQVTMTTFQLIKIVQVTPRSVQHCYHLTS